MAVQRLHVADCAILAKAGIQSRQLIWPNNSPDAQVTITYVTMVPGAVSKRHAHAHAEQIWIIEQGEGLLLLADDCSESLCQGDIVRTPAGEIHGVENTGSGPLIYLAVTTPPQNFAKAYDPPAGDQR